MVWLAVCSCQTHWLCPVFGKQIGLLENITSQVQEQKVQILTVKLSLFQQRPRFHSQQEPLLGKVLLTDKANKRVDPSMFGRVQGHSGKMQQSCEDHRIVPGFELVTLILDPSCAGEKCERRSSF